jgi:hypothetical protein
LLAFAAPVTPTAEKANSVPQREQVEISANRRLDQNRKWGFKRKSMKNMTTVLSNFVAE